MLPIILIPVSYTHLDVYKRQEHISVQEEADGFVLACRVRPTSEVQLRVIGSMKKNVCRAVDPVDVQCVPQPSNQ